MVDVDWLFSLFAAKGLEKSNPPAHLYKYKTRAIEPIGPFSVSRNDAVRCRACPMWR